MGILSSVIVAALLATGAGQAAAAPAKPRVTVIGDSVQASFSYVPKAVARLRKGYDLKMDAYVCRRLILPSCTYNGVTPRTVLQTVQAKGRALGKVVVVNVGYNESAGGYDINRVMKALRSAGVEQVIWVTLRERRSEYPGINTAIRRAATRWKGFTVADWNAVSSGRPWFGSDGLHLNSAGAMALSGLLRQKVLAVT